MQLNGKASVRSITCLIVLCAASFVSSQLARAQNIDETYKLALKEGGTLNVYGTLTPEHRGESSAGIRKALSRHQGGQHRRELGQDRRAGDLRGARWQNHRRRVSHEPRKHHAGARAGSGARKAAAGS